MMPESGIRLQLYLGPTVPEPAPTSLLEALLDLEVQSRDSGRDGFQMSFTLGRDRASAEFALLRDEYLDTNRRVVIMVVMKGQAQVLIDGIITQHQVTPSREPGGSRLNVMGEDISLKMDLEEKRKTHANQADSVIVDQLLRPYRQYGISPDVTSTRDTPTENRRLPAQDGTDLRYIHMLAERNSFVFYIEPTGLGRSTAYWGPDHQPGEAPQPPLTMNMGAFSNGESLNFSYDALLPTEPNVSVLDSGNRSSQRVSPPASLRQPLSARPAVALRRTFPPGTAGLSMTQAELRAQAAVTRSADAATCNGELDSLRYGRVLRARKLVTVRGVGSSYDGTYHVRQVTHRISRGQYRQSFTLVREGRGAKEKSVQL